MIDADGDGCMSFDETWDFTNKMVEGGQFSADEVPAKEEA